jgi:hypothetical protein
MTAEAFNDAVAGRSAIFTMTPSPSVGADACDPAPFITVTVEYTGVTECEQPKIIPWVEINKSSQPQEETWRKRINKCVAGLEIWRRVTDTAEISTTPGQASLYETLHERVPDMIAASLSLSQVGQGPVINLRGEVVGLAVDLPNLHFEGGLYLIPAARLRKAYRLLKERQEAAWPWLGVEVEPLSPSLAKALRLPVDHGVVVSRVFRRSPAARAGLRAGRGELSVGNLVYRVGGDVIVSVDGQPVHSPYEFFRLILAKKPGDEIKILYYRYRDRKKKSLKLRLGRRTFLHP